jgi:hypothetical protein
MDPAVEEVEEAVKVMKFQPQRCLRNREEFGRGFL